MDTGTHLAPDETTVREPNRSRQSVGALMGCQSSKICFIDLRRNIFELSGFFLFVCPGRFIEEAGLSSGRPVTVLWFPVSYYAGPRALRP